MKQVLFFPEWVINNHLLLRKEEFFLSIITLIISPAASSPRQDTGSMMRAAENRIAQDKLEFKKSKGVSPVTVAGGVAALLAALAAAFLL